MPRVVCGPGTYAGRRLGFCMPLPSIQTVTGWYDQSAAGYDAGHHATQRKYKVIEQSLRGLLSRGRVLDLGCGTGRLLNREDSGRVVGLDLSIEMLRLAHQTSPSVLRADGHHLPFASESFDAVVAAQGVIRYMDPAQAFAEIHRVLTPGGRCAVHQFGSGVSLRQLVRQHVLRRPAPPADDFVLLDAEELARPARGAGLRVHEVELFRSIRRYPYALRVHPKLPSRVSDALWNHCVLHLQKPLS